MQADVAVFLPVVAAVPRATQPVALAEHILLDDLEAQFREAPVPPGFRLDGVVPDSPGLLVEVGDGRDREKDVTPRGQMIGDVAEQAGKILLGNVLHHLPGGDGIELDALASGGVPNGEQLGDVAGVQVVGNRSPLGELVDLRPVAPLQPDREMAVVEDRADETAPGTAEVEDLELATLTEEAIQLLVEAQADGI